MTVYEVKLNGIEPVLLPKLEPGDAIYIVREPAQTCGTLTLRHPPTAILPAVVESLSKVAPGPNRGPYASDQPRKKGKKR